MTIGEPCRTAPGLTLPELASAPSSGMDIQIGTHCSFRSPMPSIRRGFRGGWRISTYTSEYGQARRAESTFYPEVLGRPYSSLGSRWPTHLCATCGTRNLWTRQDLWILDKTLLAARQRLLLVLPVVWLRQLPRLTPRHPILRGKRYRTSFQGSSPSPWLSLSARAWPAPV